MPFGGALQERVYHGRKFENVEQLKQAILLEWRALSQRFIDCSINQWRRRLQGVVQENGGHIENVDGSSSRATVEYIICSNENMY